ncbi:MAG: diguanylate cyclase, partial [Planctomycetes bacterium]|nr:diguanylate cyclase [Planctomycetota bacterium]
MVVAEDDDLQRQLIVRHLRDAGFNVIACENGKVALGAIQRLGACTVLSDGCMPQLDGFGLLKATREMMDLGVVSYVHFIMLTANDNRDSAVAALEAGADDYLTKPYHPQELLARLRVGDRFHRLHGELSARQIEVQRSSAEVARMYNKLEQLSRTDALTGLVNRRYFLERAADIWTLARRHSRNLSCIMIDIDHFKSINDTHGHAAGDFALRRIAAVAREQLRTTDLLGRFGGEEFCMLCP